MKTQIHKPEPQTKKTLESQPATAEQVLAVMRKLTHEAWIVAGFCGRSGEPLEAADPASASIDRVLDQMSELLREVIRDEDHGVAKTEGGAA